MASDSDNVPRPNNGCSGELDPALKALVNSLPSFATEPAPNEDRTQAIKGQWLNSQYLSGADIDFRIRDFATIKAATHRYDSYWRDAHVDWALELLRNRHGQHRDIRIVGTALAARLYSLSQRDSIPARTSQEYRENWRNDEVSLRERPLLFIPVNDGYEQQYRYEATDTAQPNPAPDNDPPDSRTVVEKTVKRSRSGAHGNHWSFMVLDMRNERNYTARYVDGMVRLTRNRSGRLKIHDTNFNAPIAGRIVCALEKLLQMPEGSFQISTMKFVPHMNRHDQYQGLDYGRCGPHLYAFMDHLLANRTSLIDPGLETTFNDQVTMTARRNAFRFNSAIVRARFADELLHVRKTQEAGSGSVDVDNLSHECLRSIITPDVLTHLIKSCKTSLVSRGGKPKHTSKRKGGDNDSSDNDGGGGDDTKDREGDGEDITELRKKWREQLANGNPHGCDSFKGFVQMLVAQYSFDDTSGRTGNSGAGSSSKARPVFSEVLRKEAINFIPMNEDQIWQWVEKVPISTLLNHNLELWHQKAIL
jgi:hypothetical protein